MDEAPSFAHIVGMERLEPTDSQHRAIRAIERWKRGLGALIFLGVISILPAVIAFAAGYALIDMLDLNYGWWPVLPAVAAIIVGPWCLGQRSALRTIGKAAELADD